MSLMTRQTFEEAKEFSELAAKQHIKRIRSQIREYVTMPDSIFTEGEEQYVGKMIADEIARAFK